MSSLYDIVERIYLEAQRPSSIFRNTERYWVNFYAKEGLNNLHLTFATHLKAMNIQIPSVCKVYKPEGFQAFVRAYLINCDGKKIEIVRNNNIPTEIFGYLVQCDGTLISDCSGDLTTHCLGCNEAVPIKECCIDTEYCCKKCNNRFSIPCDVLEFMNDLERHKNSWIKEHPEYFEFSADLEDMWINIEFLTNQTIDVEECQINVDKKYELALEYYIKYRLLEGGQDTMPYSEQFRYKYKAARERLSINENALTRTDIWQSMVNG
ncbi:MAG: hypothetical protein LBE36_06635 [Flavobacteriaceae bacterium]|jgi:hypothetical protein|nr:hypothetical protein [Flavobacteriaceae bacterium]